MVFFVIYKSDVEWPRKDIKDTGPMGVPRSAKNDHFMAPVSQNQRQTVEKARLMNLKHLHKNMTPMMVYSREPI